MSTQNLRQILAAVLQDLVEGSAAFLVPGVDVGAVFDEKLDDLNHVPLALEVCRGQRSAAVMTVTYSGNLQGRFPAIVVLIGSL